MARVPVATVFALTSDNHLVSFKPLTPGTFDTDVAVTGLQGAEAIVGLDFRPSNGALYAVTDAGRVYTVDTATGAAAGAVTLTANPADTTAPFTALAGTRFGVDFSPVDNVLRVQSDTGQNLRVDVDTGTVITDGAPESRDAAGGRHCVLQQLRGSGDQHALRARRRERSAGARDVDQRRRWPRSGRSTRVRPSRSKAASTSSAARTAWRLPRCSRRAPRSRRCTA